MSDKNYLDYLPTQDDLQRIHDLPFLEGCRMYILKKLSEEITSTVMLNPHCEAHVRIDINMIKANHSFGVEDLKYNWMEIIKPIVDSINTKYRCEFDENSLTVSIQFRTRN